MEKAVTALVILEGHDEAKRADKRLQAMLRSLVNQALDRKLNSVEFENPLLQKFVQVIPSHRRVEKMTEVMLDN